MHTRRIFLAAFAIIAVAATGANPEDNWQVVERHMNNGAHGRSSVPQPRADGTTLACGERSRPAAEPYTSIMNEIEELWGVDFPLYESVSKVSPHTRPGGCIFYSSAFLDAYMSQWMNIRRRSSATPMLYAILAHEVGHAYHGDFDWRRDRLTDRVKELDADQFAGYTMARLSIRLDADDVTRYYQLTGDDFLGRDSGHGTGSERAAAFMDGWRRAKAGLPERSDRPAGGFGAP